MLGSCFITISTAVVCTLEDGNRDESVSGNGLVSCDIQVVVGGESFAVY